MIGLRLYLKIFLFLCRDYLWLCVNRNDNRKCVKYLNFNIMRKYLLFVIVMFACIGCQVSPYEKGVSLADEYNNCLSSYFNALDEVGEDFANKVPGSYISRKAAIEDYLSLMRECHQEYLDKWGKIELKEQKIRKGFKSMADVSEFEAALSENQEMRVFCYEPDAETVDLSKSVLMNVRKIIPQKPTEQQIQQDLVGHSLSEGKMDGYYQQSWKWTIAENSISNFKILSVDEDSNSRYAITVSMRLNSDTRSYDTKAAVCYKLDNINDWEIEFIQSQGMNIVKTHQYDNCVRCYFGGGIINGLYAENNCEIALEVAGRNLAYDNWEKFCCIVPPHQSKLIRYSSNDFIVDYIERP